MEKLLEKIHEAQAYANIGTGLGIAASVIRRRLMEAQTPGEVSVLLRSLGDIILLMEEAKNNIPTEI